MITMLIDLQNRVVTLELSGDSTWGDWAQFVEPDQDRALVLIPEDKVSTVEIFIDRLLKGDLGGVLVERFALEDYDY